MKPLSIVITTILTAVVLGACRNGLAIPSTTNQAEVTVASTTVVEPRAVETISLTKTTSVAEAATEAPVQAETSVAEAETETSTSPLATPLSASQLPGGGNVSPSPGPVATLNITATGLITPVASATPTSGGGAYAAEKIRLAPFNINFDIASLSARSAFLGQSTDPPPINFGGWSNSGQMFNFAILSPDYLTDPTAPQDNNLYSVAELWIANLDGTDLRKITDQYGGSTTWSPDDTQIVYHKQFGVSKRDLWAFNLETNRSLKLANPPGVDIGSNTSYGDIAWLDNQSLLYPAYAKTGEHQLWLHNIETGHIEEVLVDPEIGETWRSLRLGPDKVSILGRTDRDYWLGKLVQTEGQPGRLDYVKTLISDELILAYWSPDSAKLAIQVLGEFDKENIFKEKIVQILDLNSEQVTEIPFPNPVATVDWSPDSLTILVTTFPSGSDLPNPIYVANIDGSSLRQLDEFYFGYIQWAPDGKHLGLFISDDTNDNNPFGIIKVEITP